ncbi:MAG: hypothetical protein LC099_03080 [Anaerolineales bacterium]|nr:hypothetical protein [Anaerolineales bacterium]
MKRGCARFGIHSETKQRAWLMLADAGFNAKAVLSPLDIIPPIRRRGIMISGVAVASCFV